MGPRSGAQPDVKGAGLGDSLLGPAAWVADSGVQSWHALLRVGGKAFPGKIREQLGQSAWNYGQVCPRRQMCPRGTDVPEG